MGDFMQKAPAKNLQGEWRRFSKFSSFSIVKLMTQLCISVSCSIPRIESPWISYSYQGEDMFISQENSTCRSVQKPWLLGPCNAKITQLCSWSSACFEGSLKNLSRESPLLFMNEAADVNLVNSNVDLNTSAIRLHFCRYHGIDIRVAVAFQMGIVFTDSIRTFQLTPQIASKRHIIQRILIPTCNLLHSYFSP